MDTYVYRMSLTDNHLGHEFTSRHSTNGLDYGGSILLKNNKPVKQYRCRGQTTGSNVSGDFTRRRPT